MSAKKSQRASARARRVVRRGAALPVAPVAQSLEAFNAAVIECRRCPRLVAHREAVAREPPRRFVGQQYWARPLPGFGDPAARLIVVGLAPAAHGGNRTGRFFTGDQSGVWLFRALHEAGFANQPESTGIDDGLALRGAWVTAVVRCAPPDNKPLPAEKLNCSPWFRTELMLLAEVRVVVALGAYAWQGYLGARRELGLPMPERLPVFGHGAESRFADGTLLIGSYHPSQQNTFTGRLTRPMLGAIFERARQAIR